MAAKKVLLVIVLVVAAFKTARADSYWEFEAIEAAFPTFQAELLDPPEFSGQFCSREDQSQFGSQLQRTDRSLRRYSLKLQQHDAQLIEIADRVADAFRREMISEMQYEVFNRRIALEMALNLGVRTEEFEFITDWVAELSDALAKSKSALSVARQNGCEAND